MYLFFLCILILIIILGISYYTFRLAFLAPPHLDANHYFVPEGPQYDALMNEIKLSVGRMAIRPYESVTIKAFDGSKLFARYFHLDDSAPLQILFHGYKSSPLLDCSGGTYFSHLLRHNTLVVDQRSHGASDGMVITFGIKERRDCLSWIEYGISRLGENVPIILSGLSMGASTVLMAADLPLPCNVKGIIADCPYSSPKEIILKVGKERGFPPALMYPFLRLGATIFGHFDLEESSALEAVKNSSIPILLFHGEEDTFVPCEMSKRLWKEGKSHITLVTVPGAGHGLSYLVEPDLYEDSIKKFLREISIPFPASV